MTVHAILRVLRAFYELDGIGALEALISPLKYPGKFHPLSDIVKHAGLSKSTVYRTLEFLVSIGVVERRYTFSLEYKLLVWEFEYEGVHYEVEVNRVVAYI